MTGEITARLGGSLTRSWFRRAALGSCLACALLASLSSTAGAAVFGNTTPITIPASGNASQYPSPIVVSGMTGTITDVNVTLSNYSHTDPEDVAVVLVPPNGTNILLMDGPGGTAAVSNVTITLDDQAAGYMPESTAFASGSYKPTGYFPATSFPAPGPGTNFCHPGPFGGGSCTLAQALNGNNPNGTWNLYVIDVESPDTGTISGGWSVDILSAVQPPRTLTVSRNGTGNGTVTGTGIDCGADCTEPYAGGLAVALTATPAAGSAFAGWTGCDNPAGSTCTMSMTADKAVIATFTAAAQPPPSTPTPTSPAASPGVAQTVPAQSPDAGIVNCAATVTVATNGTARLCDATNPPTASTSQSLTGTLPRAKAVAAKRKKARPRTLTLGTGQTTVPAGETRPVEIKLTGATKRALRKRGRLKAAATIEARGNDGQTATVKRTLTFKPAKKRKRK